MKRSIFILFLFLFHGAAGRESFAVDNATIATEGLRDVRGPVSFSGNYLILAAVLFLLIAAGVTFFAYAKRNRKKPEEVTPVDPRSPWEIAEDQLEALAKSSYLQERLFKEYYSELSGIIRSYFENRFHIRAPEMTTEEFLWLLERSDDLTAVDKETLKKFMASCDIIKFAKHIPSVEEAQDSFQFARQLVEGTKIKDDL